MTNQTLRFGVLFYEGCDELDVIGPANVFYNVEAAREYDPSVPASSVHLIGQSTEPLHSGHGVVLQPDTSYADCPPLDVLVVAGGSGGVANDGGRHLEINNETTLSFIRDAHEHGTLIGSVCTGAFLLAGAGLLAGRRANTHWTRRDELVLLMDERGEAFEIVVERVVDDGDVVTAGGVSSGIDLAVHLVRRVVGDIAGEVVHAAVERETPPAIVT